MPASQPTSGPAVVSVIDLPVISAVSASYISPASAEITSITVDRSTNQRALAPPTQYVQVGEKFCKSFASCRIS